VVGRVSTGRVDVLFNVGCRRRKGEDMKAFTDSICMSMSMSMSVGFVFSLPARNLEFQGDARRSVLQVFASCRQNLKISKTRLA
jgi:hypothetical protein